MPYSKEQIIEALEAIKNTCRESECCAKCPITNNGLFICSLFAKIPENWEINKC